MQITIPNFTQNPTQLLRRAGYTFQHHTQNNEISFILPLSQSGFPRFHIYAKIQDGELKLNLHLDQKKQTYGKETRHHGEYENSDLVKNEAERLKKFLN